MAELIKVEDLKLKLHPSGVFFESPLMSFEDSDIIEERVFDHTDEENKPIKVPVEVCVYEGKGIVKGYAHENNGRIFYSTQKGETLSNVTAIVKKK